MTYSVFDRKREWKYDQSEKGVLVMHDASYINDIVKSNFTNFEAPILMLFTGWVR